MTAEKIFDELYEIHYDYVLKYIICKCDSLDNVEDIIQNVFVKLYSILEKNLNYAEDYRALLIKLAKNELYQYYSLKEKNKLFNIGNINDENNLNYLENIADFDLNIEDEIIQKSEIDDIWKEIKKEDILTQKILTLYFLQDEKIKDIAFMLELNESSVKTKIYRTINKIKENLGKEEK